MKHHKPVWLLILLAVLFVLPSCGSAGSGKNEEAAGVAATENAVPAPTEEGYYTLDPNEISAAVRHYNYDVDGTTVQLLALRDDAGGIHVAFNTCQSCSPSPKAYYLQDGDRLVCQNCGFDFTADEVGITQGGCNPWPVDGIEITEEAIRIPVASVEAMAPKFANWGGPKE